ncbi:MAG: M1 family metallopeptidase [Eubacterium pyruvativorans]|uniref:M1 family metallopeptidase n=1 Tax=Eubacterium pyruvativorans TaxID=155865 RepID=UPI00240A4C65|nr:M1 family metallopeptidase [Eubacterium pyruvativorans]MDD6708432.1 M1 family metallopeptidase [Eubacterium pyruvativorans]
MKTMIRRLMTVLLSATLLLGITNAPLIGFADTASPAASASAPAVRAEHYSIQASLDTKKKLLRQTVTMRVANHSGNPLTELCIVNIADGYLRYDRKYYRADVPKSAKTTVRSITAGETSLRYRKDAKDPGVLTVSLGDRAVPAGGTLDVTVKVTTSVPKREDRFGYTGLGKKGTVYNLSFCFPYLSDYQNGKWVHHPYYDDGENRNSAVTDYDVTFRAPASYRVAATGSSETKNGVTSIQARNVRDLAIVACNAFRKDTFTVQGITVNNYWFPNRYGKTKYMDLYRKVCRMVARDSIELYTKHIGPYPYDELDITEGIFGFGFGGMEYPGLVMINGTQEYLAKSRATCDFYAIQNDISHEIGHQWFYASVGNDEYREAWLDEGMASFLQNELYGLSTAPSTAYVDKIEKAPGQTARMRKAFFSDARQQIRYRLKTKEKTYVNIPANRFPKGLGSTTIPYGYGENFISYLYVTMGETKFDAFLQDYYKTYMLGRATTDDFLRVLRRHDNSKQVNGIIGLFIRKS